MVGEVGRRMAGERGFMMEVGLLIGGGGWENCSIFKTKIGQRFRGGLYPLYFFGCWVQIQRNWMFLFTHVHTDETSCKVYTEN